MGVQAAAGSLSSEACLVALRSPPDDAKPALLGQAPDLLQAPRQVLVNVCQGRCVQGWRGSTASICRVAERSCVAQEQGSLGIGKLGRGLEARRGFVNLVVGNKLSAVSRAADSGPQAGRSCRRCAPRKQKGRGPSWRSTSCRQRGYARIWKAALPSRPQPRACTVCWTCSPFPAQTTSSRIVGRSLGRECPKTKYTSSPTPPTKRG